MTQEIKPCPCGGEVECSLIGEDKDGKQVAQIACFECQKHNINARSKNMQTAYTKAVKIWNTKKG